jgi:hypothetical protein
MQDRTEKFCLFFVSMNMNINIDTIVSILKMIDIIE